MTVSSTELKNILIASGETSFSYEFAVEDTADVKVYFTIAGVDVLQTAYVVDSLDLEQGGNIIFDTAPAVNTKITIIRDTVRTQDTNYVENDPFPAEAHEDALDKLTHIVQEQDEKIARCIRLPMSDYIASTTDLPDIDRRKLQFIMFDQDGQITTASGQLIESAHTHTTLDNLRVFGPLSTDYTFYTPYLNVSTNCDIANPTISGGVIITGNISMDGTININGNETVNNITANNGVFTDISTDTLAATSFNVGTINATDIDLSGVITIGENNGLELYCLSNTSRMVSSNASEHICARIMLVTLDSTDLGGAPHTYFSTNYDATYKYTISLGGSVIGKTFRATDFDYDVPTFEGDANVFISAGDKMVFSIDKDNIGDPQSFKWISNAWDDDDGTQLMQLTDSGTLNVSGTIQQNGTQVSLVGHTHDDRYYTEGEVDTISGTLNTKIDTTSGTLSSALASHTHTTFNYGTILTVSGTYIGETMTVVVDDAAAVFGSVLAQGADFNYDLADADSSTTSPAYVMALETSSGTKTVLVRGQICNTDWNWSAGKVYLSTTSGGMQQTVVSGTTDQVQVIGWALSADTIMFSPTYMVVGVV
jgi:hypothetical protein